MTQTRKRLMIVGLDCLEPSLAFSRWADAMPFLSKLRAAGAFARMRSITPPITVPAWQCLATGCDPGVLGVYGFRNRQDYSYGGLKYADSRSVKEKRLWDYLSRVGKKNIILGVPLTHPAQPLSGVLAAGFPLPGKDAEYTYPASLKQEIQAICDYIPDVEEYRSDRKGEILTELITMMERRFDVAERLLQSRDWDLFMMVEMGTDRIMHLLLAAADASHLKHRPNDPLGPAVRNYYTLCDRLLQRLVEPYLNDPGVNLLVVSDHGAQPLDGGLRINEWLIDHGWLVLKSRPTEAKSLASWIDAEQVDWSKTRAWSDGGYYARIMLNVAGREPQGRIPAADYETVRTRLADDLQSIHGPAGEAWNNFVYRPQDVYREANGTPPDLLAMFNDLRHRALGTITPRADRANGAAAWYSDENDAGSDDANHSWEGCLVAAGEGVRSQGETPTVSLLDVAPTVLDYFGLPSPGKLHGRHLPLWDAA
ncbi:MAG TPA: alkaline phosphatase family protein [Pirellulales bacterium]